ncbi:unnamed protein product [Meganyctiphanes norvegica]|uniref:RING-type domain-containing protein n=1 Tax=Meganyctiphanes norvegica TaxID=48144 RepID=A0AAV2QW88_MEGNR
MNFKEDTECIVCFSHFDGEEHRPRSLRCGHTICTECLETAIRRQTKKCPNCRILYSADNVNEMPINYNLEGVMKLLDISKTSKGTDLPECPEHQLKVTHRCSRHKAWVCQNCLKEDHSSDSCKIITVTGELKVKKSKQLDKSKSLLSSFEETCHKVDDCKKQCKKQIKECDLEITRLENELQMKKDSKVQLEEQFAILDQKLDNIKGKRSSYAQAVSSIKSSETIREVSECSLKLQNEAEKLKSISHEIQMEVESMLQNFKFQDDHLLGYLKLSVQDGRTHLHVLQVHDTYTLSPDKLQYTDETAPPLTDGLVTFFDMAWPWQEPRKVILRCSGTLCGPGRTYSWQLASVDLHIKA